MRGKTLDVIENKKTYRNNPGPGAYTDIDLDPKTGRFNVSKFGDSKLAKINPKTPRFLEIKESPGPHSYREADSMSTSGKYLLSGHRGNGSRAFDQQARLTFTDNFSNQKKTIPGPGDY